MTALEVTQAVDAGKTVFWVNQNFKVEHWPLCCTSCIVSDKNGKAYTLSQGYANQCYIKAATDD